MTKKRKRVQVIKIVITRKRIKTPIQIIFSQVLFLIKKIIIQHPKTRTAIKKKNLTIVQAQAQAVVLVHPNPAQVAVQAHLDHPKLHLSLAR